MTHQTLSQAINRFTQIIQNVPDAELQRPWGWQSYDSEGIRFAFFRTHEELRDLAVQLHQERIRQGKPLTNAQKILGYYHAAYLDLRGALLGLEEKDFDLVPTNGEWPLRKILAHIISADLGFYVVIKFALEEHRQGRNQLNRVSKEDWIRLSGMDEAAFGTVMNGLIENLLAYYESLHQRTLAEFTGIQTEELDKLSIYWEKEPMSIQFRLQRFESHLRQHTIQIDKTLADLNHTPNEAKHLSRMIFSARSEAESLQIGANEIGEGLTNKLAQTVATRTNEIVHILNGPDGAQLR